MLKSGIREQLFAAAAGAFIAVGTCVELEPLSAVFGDVYLLLILAVGVASIFGGGVAGLLTFAIAGLGLVWAAAPSRSFLVELPTDQARLALFLLIGAVLIWAGESRRRLLSRAQEQLEQRAALLAREIQAKEELERAGRLRDDFISTLSHELRTPLSSILGWAGLLREKARPQDRHGLEVIERNASAQTQMIDDLLDLTRLQAGKLRLDAIETDLGALARSACDALVPLAKRRDIYLKVVAPTEPVIVHGDPARLGQILTNLLTNAVKFSPDGATVELDMRHDARRVILEVRDHGLGIAPAFLPHVFERFRQQDEGLRRTRGGLGLGLAIAKELADLHEATLTAESPGTGQGATFRLELPAYHRAAPAAVAQNEALSTTSLSATRVLVVEDDPDGAEMISQVLANAGADVHVSNSADDAVAWLRAHPCDVVASDVAMPEHDGYWMIRELRRISEPRIPALALTALGGQDERDRLLAAGFDAYVSKPFDPRGLVDIVRGLARATA